MVNHSLLQWIFPTQRSNLGLPHCRWILYRLNHQGSPVHMCVCVCVCNSLIDHNISPYFYDSKFPTYEFIFMIVRSLHMNLQVVNFQRCKRIFACPITEVSPGVWHALSHVCLLCKWLCLCVLHCILLYIAVVVRCLYFKPRMSRSKCKSRSDAHVQPITEA